jgi:hypothetical protein
MISVKLSSRRAIMRVSLIDRIDSRDFQDAVTPAVERMQAHHGGVELMILDVRHFAGWGDVGTFAEQIRFLRRFGRSFARVAVMGSAAWAGAVPAIAALFVASEIRSYTPQQGRELRAWMRKILRGLRRRAAVAADARSASEVPAMLLL